MKASFFERVGSYFIDIIITSLILSLIYLGFGNYTSSSEKKLEELDQQLIAQEITTEEYIEKYQDVLYDYQKDNALKLGISVALSVAYFVVFQYMNKGQTLGKKILKIRVVDKDTKKPTTMLKGLIRSLIILSILSGALSVGLLYILNKSTYFTVYTILLFLESIFTITTVVLVLYKKDGRGLHDMMANTIVIKESR